MHAGRARTRWLAVLLTSVIVASVAGYVAGTRVRSPSDVVASAQPPPDSVLTAPVREGSVEGTETFTGSATWNSIAEVGVPPSDGQVRPIVTRTPIREGSELLPGAVLAEIADRPVFVLPGAVPMLRDLYFGDRGEDVARLQDGLRGAAVFAGSTDGIFGQATYEALSQLYADAGYVLPETSGRSESSKREPHAHVGYASMAEIVFAPTLPSTLLRYRARVGSEATEAIADLGVGGLVIRLDVPVEWQQRLRATNKDAASVQLRLKGARSRTGSIIHVGRPRVVEGKGNVVALTIRPGAGELPTDVAGSQVQVALNDPSAPFGLLVPLSALYNSADQGAYVRVLRGGEPTRVAVRVEGTGDGTAVVAPIQRNALEVADEVIVGVDWPDR
jgi:hypothetical protein